MRDLAPINPPPQPPAAQDSQFFGAPDEFADPASPIRIKRFLAFLLRLWWVPVLTLVLALAGAAAFIIWKPPTFISSGRMWETVKLNLPGGTMFSEDIQNFLGTQAELLKSARLQELTLASLRAASTNALPTEKDGRPLKVKIQIIQAPKSTVFDLLATSSDPAYATAYLNSLMNQYLEYKKSVRKEVSGGTLASISSQVLRLETELKSEQEALAAFQRTNNLAILQEEGTVSGGYLARLKTQLSDLQLEDRLLKSSAADQEKADSQNSKITEYKRITDLLETLSKRRQELLLQFAPENSWVVQINDQIATNEQLKSKLESENPGLASMKMAGDYSFTLAQLATSDSSSRSTATSDRLTANRELEGLKILRERLSKYLKPKHPKITKLDNEIDRAQKLLNVFRQQSQEQLAASRFALQLKVDNIQNSIKEWEGKVTEANARIAEAEHLKQNVGRSQALYDRLVTLLENVDISRSIDQETLSILEPASLAQRSYKTDLTVGALAVFVGLAFGIGIVFLVEVRDDRVISITEVSDKIGANIVGQLPEITGPKGNGRLPLVELDDPRYMYAESYRNLRSAILFMHTNGELRPKVILITSALPNEGKSTVAANLARTLAMGGARVVLIDCDLRRGLLHEMMGMQREPGLPEFLRKPSDLDQVLQTNGMPNLTFISRGNQKAGNREVFLTSEFDQLLGRLREQFDYVLIDSSPVFAADDAGTIAPKADGTILVVRSSVSRTKAVREALDSLYQRQAKVLGIIFNGATISSGSYNQYNYAEYYSGNKT
jgi:polysaccharide biosynthesis transport protein